MRASCSGLAEAIPAVLLSCQPYLVPSLSQQAGTRPCHVITVSHAELERQGAMQRAVHHAAVSWAGARLRAYAQGQACHAQAVIADLGFT